MELTQSLLFALDVTLPIFLILCLGIALKRIGLINNEFAEVGSRLVFTVTLPCLLFVKLVTVSFDTFPVLLIFYALAATLVAFLILELIVAPRLTQHDRSAFVQGSFRSNMGMVGLAFCLNAYGEGAVATISIYLAAVTILFNVLAMITLTRNQPTNDATHSGLVKTLKHLAKNPLIIAIVLAMLLSQLQLIPPKFILNTMGYVGKATLPLALICAGASIRWRDFTVSTTLYWATASKLIFIPVFITLGGVILGLRGEQLGILYLMSSAPSASACYPMLRSVGGNHHLGATIIALSSIASVVTVTLGLFVLHRFQLA